MAGDADSLALCAELGRRAGLDQGVRHLHESAAAAARTDSARAGLDDVDRDNTAWLFRIVSADGWPRHSTVGDRGGSDAWLLAVHSDRDRAVQEFFLEQMEVAVREGEADPRLYAFLTDRVCLANGRSQIYRTQLTGLDDEDSPAVVEINMRRADVGLPLLETRRRSPVHPEVTAVRYESEPAE